MSRFLPILPHQFCCLILCLLGGVTGLMADEGAEVIKQLVFIEQHLAAPGTLDGIESPYDLKVSPDGKHLYVASQRNDAISFFERETVEGSLSYLGLVDQDDIGENALDGARSLALSPDGKFVYVVSMFSDSLSVFSRDAATGSLAFVDAVYDTDAGVDGLNGARSVVISPDGKNLYVAGYEDSMVSVYSRNLTSGVVSFQGVYQEGDQGVAELSSPHALSISPDGKHLYVALWKNEVVVFTRSETNGLLTYNSKLSYLQAENAGSSGTTRSLVVSPDGKHVYLGSWNTDSLTVFSRNATTGALTHVDDVRNSDSGVSDMDGPHAVAISSDGAFVYVAAFSSDSVTSFSRDADTGEVVYFQSIFAEAEDEWDMNGPISIGVSPDGEHVYVGSGSGTHSVVTFRREVLVDPPEFVVQPISKSIEEGESVAFHALAQGIDVAYQWFKDADEIVGETLPVLSIDSAALADDGSVFTVEVSNAGGSFTSDAAVLTVLPPIVVQAPVDLTALDISSASARLSWKDRSDNETSFEIQRRLVGQDFQTVATVLANEMQFENTGLRPATTYRFRVRAKRNETVSLWSNDAVIESFNDVPQAPASLELVEQSYNRVKLSWSDRSAVETGFRILRRLDAVDAVWTDVGTADKNATVFTDRSVSAESTYAYRVQAYNESGYSDYSNSVVAITTANPVSSIAPTSRAVPKDAVSGYAISVSSALAWEAIPSASWIVVTSPVGGAGTGNQSVSYRVSLNTSQSPRVGKVVVGGLEHTVTQAGSPPFLFVSPSRVEVASPGGARTIQVEANQTWGASENADWIEIVSGATGSDNGSVVLQISPNETFASRLAEVTINDRVVEVEQSGQSEFLEVQATPSSFESVGGAGSLTISSNIDWSASVSESWVQIVGVAEGSGNGSIDFEVAENLTTASRSADILVNSVALTVVQSGVDSYLALASEDTQVGSGAGEGSVAIASNAAWTASASQAWIEITSEVEGVGDATLGFAFEANESVSERVADIIVNDSAISIVQAGVEAELSLASDDTNFTSAAGAGTVAVFSNMQWEASVSESWIELSSEAAGMWNGAVAFNVSANRSTENRVADILVSDVALSISQAGAKPFLTLSAAETNLGGEAGEGAVSISSNVDWSARASESWVQFTSDTIGSGDSQLTFAFEANPGFAPRSVRIQVNEETIVFEQAGKSLPLSDVAAPDSLLAASEALGARISWNDRASDELGFLLYRASSGSEGFKWIAELGANVESYLDRTAQRGASYTYRLCSFEAEGRSEYATVASGIVAGSNFVKMATRAEMGHSGNLVLTEFAIAGAGEMVLQRRGFGEKLSGLSLGFEYAATRASYDTDAGVSRVLGAAPETDLDANFDFATYAPLSFATSRSAIVYGASSTEVGEVYARGAVASGDALGVESTIVIGFEVSGEYELPVLVKGVGPSLLRRNMNAFLSNPAIELYRLLEGGDAELVASNDSWLEWIDVADISLDDALAASRGLSLDEAGLEAALVADLSAGRYVAVLRSEDGSAGAAQLEVLDLR